MGAEVTHDAMTDVGIAGPRYQQAYFISREAARFGRLVRPQRFRDVEVDAADEHWLLCSCHRAHAAAGAATARPTSDATYRPLGKSPSSTVIKPGTFVSGSGRSPMSSPG